MEGQSQSTQLRKMKCREESKEKGDRISCLEDDLLLHILSFLTMDDVIRTSLFSKRWRNLWKFSKCLDFNFHQKLYDSDETQKIACWFIRFIDKSIFKYSGLKIEKLRIGAFYGDCPYPTVKINLWLWFAVTHSVEELSLDLLDYKIPIPPSWPPYKLPHSLFNCRSLTTMTLGFCDLNLPTSFHITSLKRLTLKFLDISGDEMKHFTSSCPQLETLVLDSCNIGEDMHIVIENQNLRFLDFYDLPSFSRFQISAPYLVSLNIWNWMSRTNYCLQNMSSLMKAGFYDIVFENEQCAYDWARILGDLVYVKELKLCQAYVQMLSICELESLVSFSINATCIKLNSTFMKWELPGICYLLRNASALQNLTVQPNDRDCSTFYSDFKGSYKFDFEEKGFWECEESEISSAMERLETVEIYLCEGTSTEYETDRTLSEFQNTYEFVKFVLKISKALKKMILKIVGNNSLNHELQLKITEKLIDLPRASSSVEVHVI